MRVKPYAIRSPSRNARHTALRAPGGSISTSGCSCRYRSSLRTWSGGPGGTSCTGQYRCPASGPRNRLLKTRAARRYGYPPPTWTCRRPSQARYHHYMLVGLRLPGCCFEIVAHDGEIVPADQGARVATAQVRPVEGLVRLQAEVAGDDFFLDLGGAAESLLANGMGSRRVVTYDQAAISWSWRTRSKNSSDSVA